MRLIETVHEACIGVTGRRRRLVALELGRGRWYIGTAGQAEGAPFVDGSTTTCVDENGSRCYYGVLVKLRPTAGRGLVLASNTCTAPGLYRWHLPSWMTRPRSRGEFWPRRPLSADVVAAVESSCPEWECHDSITPSPISWVEFVGGSLDGQTRPIVTGRLTDGDTYSVCVPDDQTWTYSADRNRFELTR